LTHLPYQQLSRHRLSELDWVLEQRNLRAWSDKVEPSARTLQLLGDSWYELQLLVDANVATTAVLAPLLNNFHHHFLDLSRGVGSVNFGIFSSL